MAFHKRSCFASISVKVWLWSENPRFIIAEIMIHERVVMVGVCSDRVTFIRRTVKKERKATVQGIISIRICRSVYIRELVKRWFNKNLKDGG